MANWFTRLFSGSEESRTLTGQNTPWFDSVSPAYGSSLGPVHMTQERALSLTPVFASVRLLAQDVSTLPVKAYRRIDNERVPMRTLPTLFEPMVATGEIVPWLFRCVTSLALRGNAYGLITARDGYGFPTVIAWINPAEVTDDTITGADGWLVKGRHVSREDILHIPWFSLAGKREGLSPIGAFAQTMSMGLHAQAYGHDWFQNGGFPPGKFQNTEKAFNQEQADIIKMRLVNAIKQRQPLVYGADWNYEPITVPPGEAQFIESQRLNANQVASIFGVPPEKVGGDTGSSLTYATVEQNKLDYITTTLRFWLVLLESAFSGVLPERQYVKFNADALVRSDTKTRHEVYEISRRIGLRSTNELRSLEDLPPVDGGDDFTALGRTQQQPTSGTVDQQRKSEGWSAPA